MKRNRRETEIDRDRKTAACIYPRPIRKEKGRQTDWISGATYGSAQSRNGNKKGAIQKRHWCEADFWYWRRVGVVGETDEPKMGLARLSSWLWVSGRRMKRLTPLADHFNKNTRKRENISSPKIYRGFVFTCRPSTTINGYIQSTILSPISPISRNKTQTKLSVLSLPKKKCRFRSADGKSFSKFSPFRRRKKKLALVDWL